MSDFSLDDLARIIRSRRESDAARSYTKTLLAAGPARIAKKFGEEAVEAVIAATEGDAAALKSEAADVLYHLLVLLEARGVAISEVIEELERRTVRSGLAEKAARSR